MIKTSPDEKSLLEEYFGALDDPREDQGKRHDLLDIIFITICDSVCGADDWTDIVEVAKEKQEWLKKFLNLPHGIPAVSTPRFRVPSYSTKGTTP